MTTDCDTHCDHFDSKVLRARVSAECPSEQPSLQKPKPCLLQRSPRRTPSTRFHVEWNISATRAAKARAMATGSPLKVSQNHMLTNLLPDALEDEGGANIGTKIVAPRLVNYHIRTRAMGVGTK